ncbi:hypothetical protein COY95_01875, partial [Candidatus Woesearchaeota archaeon CG_4_10_14_0_8_um_filter_47_5]
GIEGEILTYGFGATNWKWECGISIIDGVWTTLPEDNTSRIALYRGMEKDMGTRTSIIRLCSEVKLPEDVIFFSSVGFREMERNVAAYIDPDSYSHPGRVEWVKLLRVEEVYSLGVHVPANP